MREKVCVYKHTYVCLSVCVYEFVCMSVCVYECMCV